MPIWKRFYVIAGARYFKASVEVVDKKDKKDPQGIPYLDVMF